jgi:hypothetical protein
VIIGFLGQSESGKDTASDHLVKEYDFAKVAFADVMKRIVREVYDFDYLQLWGSQEDKGRPDVRYPILPSGEAQGGFLTPRKALQLLGTEIGRIIYQDTWAMYAMRVAKRILEGGVGYDPQVGILTGPVFYMLRRRIRGVVISDVRFENEVKIIHDNGGVVIRLKREGKTGESQGGIKGHASENDMKAIPDSSFDAIINVPEGKELFYKAIDDTLYKIPTVVKNLGLKAR